MTHPRWEHFVRDLRYVMRGVRKRPAFATALVLTLGLGIGANAAMFSVLNRLLFEPPADIVHPDGVRRVMLERSFLGKPTRQASVTYPAFLDLVLVHREGGWKILIGHSSTRG